MITRVLKCIRTLLTLDALGVIDEYNAVFDIEFDKHNKKVYFQQNVAK